MVLGQEVLTTQCLFTQVKFCKCTYIYLTATRLRIRFFTAEHFVNTSLFLIVGRPAVDNNRGSSPIFPRLHKLFKELLTIFSDWGSMCSWGTGIGFHDDQMWRPRILKSKQRIGAGGSPSSFSFAFRAWNLSWISFGRSAPKLQALLQAKTVPYAGFCWIVCFLLLQRGRAFGCD